MAPKKGKIEFETEAATATNGFKKWMELYYWDKKNDGQLKLCLLKCTI